MTQYKVFEGGHYAPGEYPEIALTIHELLVAGKNRATTIYSVTRTCHEGGEPEEMTHTMIYDKFRTGRKDCQSCSSYRSQDKRRATLDKKTGKEVKAKESAPAVQIKKRERPRVPPKLTKDSAVVRWMAAQMLMREEV